MIKLFILQTKSFTSYQLHFYSIFFSWIDFSFFLFGYLNFKVFLKKTFFEDRDLVRKQKKP